jgi:ATP-dependent RNA helicase HelY
MQGWANGWSLVRTLEEAEVGAGDFVRWAKQTIDLLDQIAQACETAVLSGLDEDRLGELARLAREAKRGVRRGIVEASSTS